MDWATKEQLKHPEHLRAHLKHLVIENGPNASVELVEPGEPTTTSLHVFCHGLPGSPVGSIIGLGEKRGTIRVIYTAREVLATIEEQFPS